MSEYYFDPEYWLHELEAEDDATEEDEADYDF